MQNTETITASSAVLVVLLLHSLVQLVFVRLLARPDQLAVLVADALFLFLLFLSFFLRTIARAHVRR